MKKILAFLLAAIMVFSLAACGSTESVKIININLTEEQYAFGVDKNQPELLDKVNAFIDKIMEDGTFDEVCNKYFGDGEPTAVKSAKEDPSKDQLVVATNAAFAPFEYMEGDSYYGIDMEIAALLAEELGQELVIKNMKFESVCLSVGEHTCDIAMAGLTINETRKESVNFSKSYYNAYQKLIVKADDTTFDDCTTAEQVNAKLNEGDGSKTVGYQNGTTGNFYVVGDADWGFEALDVQPKGYDNGALAVQDIVNGNIDYVIIDADPAERIVNSINGVK
ncbi:MAG: transporter substrate-binding domain-containing protein [Acutalibacteraceae bacterium]|nr:transporter substrate-binding domain-containing protein [Acutalibacteraceae bacterium]